MLSKLLLEPLPHAVVMAMGEHPVEDAVAQCERLVKFAGCHVCRGGGDPGEQFSIAVGEGCREAISLLR